MGTDRINQNTKHSIFWSLGAISIYGLLNVVSNQFLLPAAPFIALRPQIALPMFMGIAYGPRMGFITGFFGNMFGDFFSGYGMFTFWNWHIANGLMGMIPGLVRYIGIIRVKSVRDFGVVELTIVLASAVAVGFAVFMDTLLIHMMHFPESLYSWILPAFITDAVNGFILVPILLLISRRLIVTVETRTMLIITSLLILAVLSTSVTITWSVWDDLISKESMVKSFYFAGIVSLFVLVVGMTVSVFLARRITKPVVQLTKAASSVEKGDYNLKKLDDVSRRTDELGQLSRVLQEMAYVVHGREQELRQQVQELRIKIDKVKQAEEVAEIVETDYFQELRKKVKKFRKN
jgi:energy-coupling factor transport system substrate-specific component